MGAPKKTRLEITSAQNPRLKQLAKLRDKRGRNQQQRFVIDGFREVERAVNGGLSIKEFYVTPNCLTDEQQSAVDHWIENSSASVFLLPETLMDRVCYGDRNEGILAVADTWQYELTSLELPNNPLIVVLENVEKPGNLGAALRTASAAGFDLMVTCGQGTDPFNPNTIRSSTGALFEIPCVHVDTNELQNWLHEQQMQIFTCVVGAELAYYECDLTKGVAIVLGNEANGLSEAWNSPGFTKIQIPMQGIVDSLNLSVSAAIMMFEAKRQRTISTS